MPKAAMPAEAIKETVIDDGIQIRFRVDPDAWLPIEQLLEMWHPFNSQVRTPEDEEAIWASIQDRGYIGEPILVNTWNQRLISGHGRVKVLYDHGCRGKLPIIYETYESDAEHRMAMLRANMARGHQDGEKLEAELMFMRQAFEDERIERALGLEPESLAGLDGDDEDDDLEDPEAMMAEASADDEDGPNEAETLLDQEGICGVHLPGWNNIHEFSVPSIRRWVKDRREVEIGWFNKRRRAQDSLLAREVASEIVDRLEPLFGHSTLPIWVTTPPRSNPDPAHFGTQVAAYVAEDLGVDLVTLFRDWPSDGDRQRTREQGMALLAGEIPVGLCLLVDDYAVTGKTLVAAASTLRRERVAVLPIVWIYGEAAYGHPNR